MQHEHESLMLTSNAALREPFFLTNCERSSLRYLAQSLFSRDVDEEVDVVAL